MKSLLRRLLFGNSQITEYSTVTIEGNIKEEVVLRSAFGSLDISGKHWVHCLEPIVFGVWVREPVEGFSFSPGKEFEIIIGYRGNPEESLDRDPAVRMFLEFFHKIEEKEGSFILLKLKNSDLHHISPFKTSLLFNRYYKKPGLSFEKFKSLVSAYSYPRKVRIVSYKQGDYFNIFPMDLVAMIDEGKRFAFGLRHTNTTLGKIIESKKLVISEIPYTWKDIIYQLGKHHSTNPPAITSLPFNTMESNEFEFHIPEFAERYFEIKINETKNLGSHMLMWGECVNRVEFKSGPGHLYHIHFLHYLYQKRNGYSYRLV